GCPPRRPGNWRSPSMRSRSIVRRAFFVLAAFGALAAFPAVASADNADCKVDKGKDGKNGPSTNTNYCFPDDPLGAGTEGPNNGRIPVRKNVARITLIRPRTQFVTELLRSAQEF